MSTPVFAPVKIVAENVSPDARTLAPGEGRRPAVEVDSATVRAWLGAFAALPAYQAEEADARLHLFTASRRLLVRQAGGRLIMEENNAFTAATVDEIMTNLFAVGDSVSPVAAPEEMPLPASRQSGQVWLLGALLAVFAGAWWWSAQPETPEGVEWLGASESKVVLTQVAGEYASDDENLNIDAAAATLVTTSAAGEEILRTTLRIGRRAGGPVLMAENGVLLEATPTGELVVGEASYRRMSGSR